MPKLKEIKKNKKLIVGSLVFVSLLLFSLAVALFLISRPQDIRQQAASCSESPVNVEFRKYTGKDEPGWKDGSKFQDIKVGDKFDVNCFSRNGAALLSGGKFTVKLDGKSENIASSYLKTSTEIRAWEIDGPGTWEFTCSNNSGCSNTDSITVTGSSNARISCYVYSDEKKLCEQVSLPYEACELVYGEYDTLEACSQANQPDAGLPGAGSGICDTNYIADLNGDCKVNLLDYDSFLEDFSENYSE